MKIIKIIGTGVMLVGATVLGSTEVETVKFSARDFTVGDTRTIQETKSHELKMVLEMPGSPITREHNIEKKTFRKRETVLRVSSGIVRSVNVKIEEDISNKSKNGKARNVPGPTRGHTYIVERAGKDLRIKYVDGKTPGRRETKALSGQYRNLGETDSIRGHLIGKDFRVGQPAMFLAPRVKAFFSRKAAARFEDLRIVFAGTRKIGGVQCGVFTFSTVASMPAFKQMRVFMEMNGELLYRLRGAWPMRTVVSGPLAMSNEDNNETSKMKFRMTGKVREVAQYTYKASPPAPVKTGVPEKK